MSHLSFAHSLMMTITSPKLTRLSELLGPMTLKTSSSDCERWPLLEKSDTTSPVSTEMKPHGLTIILSYSISPHARGEARVILNTLIDNVVQPVALFDLSGEKVLSSWGTLPPKVRNILQAILSKK